MLAELSRKKKTAETHYRKVRLAFEGPKQPQKSSKKKDTDENLDLTMGVSKSSEAKSGDKDEKLIFVPTATKKEYVSSPDRNPLAIET